MDYKIKAYDKILGTIKASGSKNAALPIIASSLLTKEEVVLKNIPLIDDVIDMIEIINNLGVDTKYDYSSKSLTINAKSKISNFNLIEKSKIRASYYVLASLIHRKKKFSFMYPGGCDFSSRPIDIHLLLLKEFGIKVTEEACLNIEVVKLKPVKIIFPMITVGGTINAIILAVKVKGKTILKNISIEPEVIDLINFLISLGAKIKFTEERTLEIEGVKKLHGTTYEIMSDRIEIASYALLALSKPNSIINIENVIKRDIENILSVIYSLGGRCEIVDNTLTVYSPKSLNKINIKTGPYPLFPTDVQPILSTLCLLSNGTSIIEETIYKDRNSHIDELVKAGADITMKNGIIKVNPSVLHPTTFEARDLRCGFSVILASVITNEECRVKNITNITRGYEDICQKLKSIGIKCIKQM